ncbi:MAG: hypothetical protein Q8P18_22265 [Pseudomonadota bacterium]|nr:hypothetical protein [Pseudomonadota bacterium]
MLRFGEWTFATSRPAPSGRHGAPLGLVIEGLHEPALDAHLGARMGARTPAPADYLHEILLGDEHREAFFDLVDLEGLVVCKGVPCAHPTYRFVRGRSSRGRLSQGEYYHHDGCSGPTKPRVVEIRFPHQLVERHIATAVAPFPETVVAMLRELPEALHEKADLARWRARIDAGEPLARDEWDTLQGLIVRTVRRAYSAEDARLYFRGVDARAGAYVERWAWGESRFIANNNALRTMQHRRAYLDAASDGRSNGNLVKRWPAEEL